MRPSPWGDVAIFLSTRGVVTAIFWLLMIGSLAAAIIAWRTDPPQRTAPHIGRWLLRFLIGCMWWQQSLWKIPPNYGGLIHWMTEMVDHASIPLQSQLVKDIVIPNIGLFGPLVYGVEVLIGVSLILGLFTRVGAIIGLGMALNLWLGLYSAPGEWPWTYGFLVIVQCYYVLDAPGRSLGIDAGLRSRGQLSEILG